MLVLIRCNDIVSDPRAMKYIRFMQNNAVEYKLIGWDRECSSPNIDNSVFWNKRADYNVGGLTAVKNRVLWMIYVYRQLRKIKSANITIHGCDLDSAYPAACYKLFHHKVKLIFDIFDWFSATLFDQKAYVLNAFKIMERFTVSQSDKIILCEPERIEQIPFDVDKKRITVLPNIPYFNDDSFLAKDSSKCFSNDLLTFSYVGGFSKDRCLFEIVKLAEEGVINLAIAGYGDRDLEEKLESLKDCPFIKYYGKVSYQEGLSISYNSDVMYAMYSKINPNHIYAAPNKYYESMFLGKPIFTTKGIIVEKKVLDGNTGIASGESIDEIKEAISQISKEKIALWGENAHNCWKSKFEQYTPEWFNNEYIKYIKEWQ